MSDLSNKMARMGFPLFLTVLTTIYLAAAFNIRVPFDEGLAGPRFLPVVASIIMYLALIRILWVESRKTVETTASGSLMPPFQVVVATGFYVALFQPLGYVLATFLFTLSLFRIFRFETARPLVMLAYGAGVTLVFYLLFGIAFNIRLPLLPGVF